MKIAAFSVLQGFCQVSGADLIFSGQIGDGAAEFEDAVVGARSELHLLHSVSQY